MLFAIGVEHMYRLDTTSMSIYHSNICVPHRLVLMQCSVACKQPRPRRTRVSVMH